MWRVREPKAQQQVQNFEEFFIAETYSQKIKKERKSFQKQQTVQKMCRGLVRAGTQLSLYGSSLIPHLVNV